ncbi:MAG: maleylacetoacetate isomerase [Silicimonas sp.]|nr:maleylacetoacetate isomerase [Silicimonas sp.]NNL35979.1 maleylacetoacetate isomerase [Silicimonas sp.]
MKLYSYWQSTTSYRVRAVLNLKGVEYDILPVNLLTGEQRGVGYRGMNPGMGVPTLVLDDGQVLTQSLAIIDYLDATWSDPPMLPGDASRRARVLAAALAIAVDVHPVNNLRVVQALKTRFGADQDACVEWMHHWMAEGFDQFAALIEDEARFSFNDDTPDLADICLVAQAYNARRWGLALEDWPRLATIEAACLALPEIEAAHPRRQPDAVA